MRDKHSPISRPTPRSIRRALGVMSLAALTGVTASATGCISDPDCGICDPDNLVVQILSGPNYKGDQIWILSPDCEGPECPTEKLTTADYFVNEVVTCEDSVAANSETVSRTPEEYCKIAPIVVLGGEYQLEFIFNNLLDPQSIELVRRIIDDPARLEIYDWKNRVSTIEGPISRFNGDFVRGSSGEGFVTRSVNLTCIENLTAAGALDGIPFHEALLADPNICDTVDVIGGQPVPRKLRQGDMPAYEGGTTNLGFSCSNPQDTDAVDNCCTSTDWLLSQSVAKYGVTTEGDPTSRRLPADAITCDPAGDVYSQCRDFIPYVDRSGDPRSYDYDFNGDGVVSDDERGFPVPRYDLLRNLHPDDRPRDENGVPIYEQRNTACSSDNDCDDGAACIGFTGGGEACAPGTADCLDLRCTQEWFVECDDDPNTTGSDVGYCKDKRYKDRGAGACFTTDVPFVAADELGNPVQVAAGSRLSACDTDRNGVLTAEECCLPELGAVSAKGEPCDPIYSQIAALSSREIYDRDSTLPAEAKCYCTDNPGETCLPLVEKFCAPPLGTGTVAPNTYIQRPVTGVGGVIYDPAVKGFAYRAADLGFYGRARIEGAAAGVAPVGLIGETSIIDGWQMAVDSGRGAAETDFNYDSAMCSGNEYRMVFETEEGEQVLKDKVGNTLAGKNVYVFETSQFHVDITNRKPLNNVTIGPCTTFELGFSNKYDLDPNNLKKLEMWNIEYTPGEDPRCTDSNDIEESNSACFTFLERVAGGLDCTEDDVAAVQAGTAVPCLKVSSYLAREGAITFKIDDTIFGPRLLPESAGGTGWYRLVVPGLHPRDANNVPLQEEGWTSLDELWADNTLDESQKQDIYRAAFQDSCGMPMITAGLRDGARPDFWYDIQIDNASCADDSDYDGIEGSCDNSGAYFNPDQTDTDLDGFGDIGDLCAVTSTPQNLADADGDGVGDQCDSCSRKADTYNITDVVSMFPNMQVRSVPLQDDTDQDGIGDACDNCPTVANCEGFGPAADGLVPWTVNTPINADDEDICQVDKEDGMGMPVPDMIGDACAGLQPSTDAAGVIGFGPDEDFDQDGLPNAGDWCPRLPIDALVACTDDAGCGEGGSCNTDVGFCNHRDDDNDQVGNICDTCPYTANPSQVFAMGSEDDDPDGDFVGKACENELRGIKNPRPHSFREVSAFGRCCSLTYLGDGQYVEDPDDVYGNGTGWVCVSPERGGTTNGIMCSPEGVPVQQNCANPPEPGTEPIPDGTTCLQVQSGVLAEPGVVTLPPGCDEALTAAGITAEENVRLTLEDVGNDPVELWSKMCFEPQWDQDFDGVGDKGTSLDLCPFFYDPDNRPFIDESGVIKLSVGAVCAPSFIDDTLRCQALAIEGGGGDGEGETGGDTGG